MYKEFKQHFRGSDVRKNIYLNGRYSKRKRQIDVLLTENTPAGKQIVPIDAKQYRRRVDVKVVEAFEGFLHDLGATRGLLITNTGYTKAALRRAFNSRRGLELDILNFSDLGKWQAFGAVPYFGKSAFLIPAPFGWVIDISPADGRICNMFQRGLSPAAAMKQRELMYLQCWDRKREPLSAQQLDRRQVQWMRAKRLTVRVTRLKGVGRLDAKSHIRLAAVKQYRAIEATGFLEFKNTILFVVMLTPREKLAPNLRRLEHILQSALPVKLRRDNSHLIASAKARFDSATNEDERALALREIGHWYRDMGKVREARGALDASLSLRCDYGTLHERLGLALQTTERRVIKGLLEKLIRLAPENPTVYNDASRVAMEGGHQAVLRRLLLRLADEASLTELARASCQLYAAQLQSARKTALAEIQHVKGRLKTILPPTHQVFKAIQAFEQTKQTRKRKP
ncbi:MAG TPA: restriction endonuclease [Steroidobacteraceae bacterium]|nr:restriction endonuclease [Steroidobacteraceae bacterium]